MLWVCGPQSWPSLAATTADIEAARAVVRAADASLLSAAASTPTSPPEVVAARRLLAATTHPDTGEPIALPFRMAAHVPVNTVLLIGMLTAGSVAATGGWQFANQAFNAAQFYANRNASNDVSDGVLAAAFTAAVASSVGVGVALRAAAERAIAAGGATARRGATLAAMVPFLAAAAGKPLQIGIMRQDEWRSGVAVYSADGGPPGGGSRVAGTAAVSMTVAIRTLYLAPMLYLPPLHAALLRALPSMGGAATRLVSGATFVALTAASSAYVTPACMALFDQRASLPATALEPAFHPPPGSTTAVLRLYFNKGL